MKKLTILFVVLGLAMISNKSFSQTISFSGRSVPVAKIFDVIEKQTGYTFFANKDLLDATKSVNVSADKMPLTTFLRLVFNDQPVDYEINDKTIFLKKKTTQAVAQSTTTTAPIRQKVSGVITGANGIKLDGASVSIKGTSISTKADANGQFTINADPNQVLQVSYIGYALHEEPIKTRTTIDIALTLQIAEGERVVVTALGIKRQAKALTYNVQEIKGDDVASGSGGSFVNGMVGKVAGATINNSSAGPGSSSRVVMRGMKSISGNNNALYVIDGVPMPNNIRGQAEDIFSGAGQTGDFAANINPDDIESISVLSGPSAAALYGSAAANGVIVINTKKGQKNKTDISVSNTTLFSNPLILPKFQNTYGASGVGSYYSWGEKLTTPSDYKPADFFQTGVNSSSSVTLSTGTEKNQTYISLGNVTANGIIPNNKFSRYNFSARNTSSFFDGKLNMDVSFMTGITNEQNMISQGQYFNPLIAVYLFPAGDDFNRAKAFERYDPSRNLMTQFWSYGDNGLMMQNPYWVTQRNLFPNYKERYLTTLSLRYNAASWLNITGRVKLDKANDKDEKKFAASTNTLFASDNGYYSLNTIDNRQIYADVLANINKAINKQINLTANVGGSIDDARYNQYMYGGKLWGIANSYTFLDVNKSTAESSQSGYDKQKQSLFGSAQVGYQNALFLDLTARNDWASTLAGAKGQSFFYSSVGLSAVLTDLYPAIRSSKLSYLKLRTSYSQVGNEPDVFLTNPTYAIVGGYPVTQTRMPNPDLKPELTKSWELGANIALFDNFLRIDATLYSSRTSNQFFQPTLSSSSGYTSVIVNAGRVDNKGIEVAARFTQKLGKNLSWTSSATYSANRNKIVELLPGWTNPITGEVVSLHELDMSGTGSYKMILKEGGSMGDIYVNTLRTDEHGAIYVDPGSQTVAAEPNKFIYAGNSNPKHNIGWANTFKWKGLSLNVLATARLGGVVVSNTQAIMDAFGVSKASADARDAGGAIVNGRPVPAKEYYQTVGAGASGGIASRYVYRADNVRIGECTLGYDIPVGKMAKFIKSANVSIIARNLFLLYNEAPFDPELTSNTQTYFQGIDYFMMPSLRSMGVSVKLNF